RRAEGRSAVGEEQSGGGTRSACGHRRDAGSGSRNGQAAPWDHRSNCADPGAENLARGGRLCQGRQGRLLLQERGEVQLEVRDVWFRRSSEPRRGKHVADLLRADEVDRSRRGEDHRAREEGGALRTELVTGPPLGGTPDNDGPRWTIGDVRQGTVNPKVVGSSPTSGVIRSVPNVQKS